MITGSSKKVLWESLSGYHFANLVPPHLTDRVAELFGGTDACTKAFASKLSRKLGWTTGFALRAINEYKRFVYLGVVSPTNVTPSKVVDQVWHEHQLFTKGYREFCQDVINKEFDHTPELIPFPEQTLLFSQQYLDTLALYREEFNVEPPADIWAVPKFKLDLLRMESRRDRRKKRRHDKLANAGLSDTANPPLYVLVDTSTGGSGSSGSSPGFHGFGGGTSGGAGASGDWSGHSSHSGHGGDAGHGGDGGHGSHGGHGGDGGHSDSGSSGSSDGGSDGGGSSCSSSCGGGGCGGGGCGGS